ncbi:MAG: alpha/beta hydrolase [Opitutaceae bacterium]|nr:alpha/beta hydrolase [Cytophagales bacterium]
MFGKILLYLAITLCIFVFGLFGYIYIFQETKTLNQETRNEIGGSFIELSQGNVFYELKGPDSGQTVILIHGAGSGCYAWDNNFDFLVKSGFRVLRYDLYGRGFSDRPDVKYDTTLFLNQLEEITKNLKVKPPYSIVSVSMGSSIAIPFAKNNIGKVKDLVLVDPASLGDGNIAWYLTKPVLSSLLMSLYWYPRAVEKQMKEFYKPSAVLEYRLKSKEQFKYRGLKAAMLSSWQNMLTLNFKKHLDYLGHTKTNVLIVWGKNDPLISPEVSKHYMESMPQAKLVEIDKAGHLSNYERPDAFNKALLTFLTDEK